MDVDIIYHTMLIKTHNTLCRHFIVTLITPKFPLTLRVLALQDVIELVIHISRNKIKDRARFMWYFRSRLHVIVIKPPSADGLISTEDRRRLIEMATQLAPSCMLIHSPLFILQEDITFKWLNYCVYSSYIWIPRYCPT